MLGSHEDGVFAMADGSIISSNGTDWWIWMIMRETKFPAQYIFAIQIIYVNK